jgi:two-component system phosphate regulon response regulator PhoB
MKNILCVEDNPEIQILVEGVLEPFRVKAARSLKEADLCLEQERFDLVILDLELPDGDGMHWMTKLSSAKVSVPPVFVLTGKAETAHKIMAFSLGVDDYLVKPFEPLELKARVQAKLRKIENDHYQKDFLKLSNLTIQIPTQRVQIQLESSVKSVDLTSLEFRLLLTFAQNMDRVFSRELLLNKVWGNEVYITDRTVDAHIGHLRKKIVDAHLQIETVINEGYRLVLKPLEKVRRLSTDAVLS